ncbi:solute carrier family 40 member 1-like [Tubulanus polymorphus]|uniref:solute carrier family 40 member 1-like n=1 Tax=Tubulanus polymorphus TaxID=672921 RepID=UPI003DA459A3
MASPTNEKTPLLMGRKASTESQDGEGLHQKQQQQLSCCQRFAAWLQSVDFSVYCSHALSAWGDRMWSFAVGMYLVKLDGNSLRLSAIYGFSAGVLILLFGAVIGDWVDRNPRLRVARTTLILQNVVVILCAGLVYAEFQFPAVSTLWDGWMKVLCEAGIVVLTCLARLASLGNTISIERDWIVEICARDKTILTSMSAILRRIDLVTNILAPVIVGQIMTYAGDQISCIFIAAWNLVSMFVEYFLIWKVYNRVPALHHKIYKKHQQTESKNKEETERLPATSSKDGGDDDEDDVDDDENNQQRSDKDKLETINAPVEPPKLKGFMLVLSRFVMLYKGWGIYARQSVCLAGLALATLYMTVLGFDSITTGFAITQGVTESFVSGMMAAGAITGIIGTYVYERLRNRLGLIRTGLFSLTAEILCLTLCVASIWAPGSPFDPTGAKAAARNCSQPTPPSNLTLLPHSSAENSPYVFSENGSTPGRSLLSVAELKNFVEIGDIQEGSYGSRKLLAIADVVDDGCQTEFSYLSIGLLMAGIVAARFGLWMSDLTITQLFLETVHETERGVVNGVQSSCNNIMDMLKFALVIVLPDPPTFGILILISFLFICLGFVFYAGYSYRVRGHFFHIKDFAETYDYIIRHQIIPVDTEMGIAYM